MVRKGRAESKLHLGYFNIQAGLTKLHIPILLDVELASTTFRANLRGLCHIAVLLHDECTYVPVLKPRALVESHQLRIEVAASSLLMGLRRPWHEKRNVLQGIAAVARSLPLTDPTKNPKPQAHQAVLSP